MGRIVTSHVVRQFRIFALGRHVVVAALTLMFCTASNHNALGNFVEGDVITYPEDTWGQLPSPDNPAGLLAANYDAVYASTLGILEVGISGTAGHSLVFTTASNVLTYLPAFGPIGPLTSDFLDPTTTMSGAFGGKVVALRLNIDFSDAGLTLGALGIPFGDLQLQNFSHSEINLNGLTVRQFSAVVTNLLGGGSSIFYSIAELSPITNNLNNSFNGGVSLFATEHLLIAPGIPGDYNANGIVDAADYVVWRKGLGTTYTQNQYNVWRNHFGQTAGSGATADLPNSAAVPEPASFFLLLIGLLASCPCRRAKMEQAHLFISRSDMDRCPESSTNASCDR